MQYHYGALPCLGDGEMLSDFSCDGMLPGNLKIFDQFPLRIDRSNMDCANMFYQRK
jgi:hypothetical protein